MIITFPLVLVDLLIEGLCVYGFSKLLPMRLRPLFVLLDVGVLLFVNTVGTLFLNGFAVIAIMVGVRFILPFVLFKGSKPVRAVIVILGNLLIEIPNIFGHAFLTLSTGQPMPEGVDALTLIVEANVSTYIVGSALGLLILFFVVVLISTVLKRYELAGRTDGSWVFVAFSLVQGALFVLGGIIPVMVDVDIWFFLLLTAIIGVCIALDLLIIWSMDNYVRKVIEDERAAGLQKQIDEHLKNYEPVTREIESIAKIHHDFRNQAHVALELSEQGAYEQARQHVVALRASIDIDHETLAENKKEDGTCIV